MENIFFVLMAGVLSPFIPIPLTVIGIIISAEHHSVYLTAIYLYIYIVSVDVVSIIYNHLICKWNLYNYVKNIRLFKYFTSKMSKDKNSVADFISKKLYQKNILIKMIISRILMPFTLFYPVFVLYRKSLNYPAIFLSGIIGLTPRIFIISGLIAIGKDFILGNNLNYFIFIITIIIAVIYYKLKNLIINN